MKRFALLLVSAYVLVCVAACGKDKPTGPDFNGAAAEAAAGDEALARGAYADANQHYRTALAKDANNAQANVGAAVTEIYLLQNDPQVDSLLRAIEGLPTPVPARGSGLEASRANQVLRGVGLSAHGTFDPISNGQLVAHMFMNGAADPPALSRIQQVIKLKVMPKLQYAEERLNVVEAHPDWRYLLPPEVTQAPDTVELDLGEVFAIDALINNVQGWLGIVVAYNFDIPYPADSVKVDSLLAPGTDFGKLWTDDPMRLAHARDNYIVSKTRLDQAITFINAETDDQADDVIPRAALTNPDFLNFKAQFDKAYTSLNSAVGVDVRNYQRQPVTIQVLTKNFFTSPITDWKTKLPAHTYSNHDPVITNPITFPDPLFNGIFPGMTNAAWQALIGPVGPPRPSLRASR